VNEKVELGVLQPGFGAPLLKLEFELRRGKEAVLELERNIGLMPAVKLFSLSP